MKFSIIEKILKNITLIYCDGTERPLFYKHFFKCEACVSETFVCILRYNCGVVLWSISWSPCRIIFPCFTLLYKRRSYSLSRIPNFVLHFPLPIHAYLSMALSRIVSCVPFTHVIIGLPPSTWCSSFPLCAHTIINYLVAILSWCKFFLFFFWSTHLGYVLIRTCLLLWEKSLPQYQFCLYSWSITANN